MGEGVGNNINNIMHLHVILCYCSAAQQQCCGGYSSHGSNNFSKSGVCRIDALVRYREHLNNNNRKENKIKQKTGRITHKIVLENVSIKVICINTPSSLFWPDSLRARCVLLYHFG